MKKVFLFSCAFIMVNVFANSEYPITSQVAPPSTMVGVANLCPYPVWFEYTHSGGGTLPHLVKVDPLNQYDYAVNTTNPFGFRLTPKLFCNANGENCSIGSSTVNGQDIPSINTIFEMTTTPTKTGPITYDISLVDGSTIPVVVKTFQGDNENNGECTDIDDGNLPYPPIMLDPKSATYTQQVAAFDNYCQVETPGTNHSDNNFLTNNVVNNPPDYVMPWFGGNVPANNTNDLLLLKQQIVNPSRILSQGGNPNSNVIACASPGARFMQITPSTASTAADGQGVFHGVSNWTSAKSYGYDADILMVNCPFANADIVTQLSGGTSAYLSPYDANHGAVAANNPFYQLISLFNNPTKPEYSLFVSTNESGVTSYSASLLCKYGPAPVSYWTKTIHEKTTFTYAYSYDDNAGTRVCNDINTKVVFVACGQMQY